jgi:hypothetical protein
VQLPFSESQFLDVFAAYNRALWPFAAVLWVVTLVAVVRLVQGRAGATTIAALLAVHWAWSGLVYHGIFFARINPAARPFATLFLIQAVLFAWVARGHRLTFDTGRAPRHYLGGVLVLASLLYPALALATGHHLPRAPTFGVPCPTTLLTAGLLLAAAPPVPRWLFVIPIAWSIIGGSAALVLSMTPDLLLFGAGLAMLSYAVAPRALSRERAGSSPARRRT